MLRRHLTWISAPLLMTSLASVAIAEGPEDSVVRVSASIRYPNFVRPWARQNPVEKSGTGVVIDGKTILTNAHIVYYASEVFVQDRQGGDRVEAKVATIGPGIDLATLTLGAEDEPFFEKHPAMPRAEKRPTARTPVDLMGFSVGGVGLSTTSGVVSRVDFAQYGELSEGLRLQVDAAVNPGNSGGPALVGGRMVGLTFGQLGAAENVGYVIPNEEINAYLEDFKDGKYDGKMRIAEFFQAMDNDALRAKLGLGKADRGIMIRRPRKSDAGYPVREGDVIIGIGGQTIDNVGMVAYEENLQLPFTALASKLGKDGTVPIRLVRDGKPLDVTLPLTREDDRLIKTYHGQYPSYYVHGPLVFSPAMMEAIPTYARGNPSAFINTPLTTRESDEVAFPGEELVVVTAPMLPHRITRGYRDPFGQVVKEVDGVPVKNLRHLVELLRDGENEFVTFRFHGDLTELLVFRRKAMEDSTAKLMAEQGIPSRASEDLMDCWQKKNAPAK